VKNRSKTWNKTSKTWRDRSSRIRHKFKAFWCRWWPPSDIVFTDWIFKIFI